MKSFALLALTIVISTTAASQVRFIDAPYPGATQPLIQPSGQMMPSQAQFPFPIQASATSPAPAAMRPGFEVTVADVNLRKALVRWSKLVGWTFEPEHWTVDRDIPVAGSASLGSDFKTATRNLLSSTQMTDLPVQPCFYSNNVLRVIPYNELCSRQQASKSE